MIYVVSFLCSNEYLIKKVTLVDDFIVMCNTITLHAFLSGMVGKQVLTESSLLLQFVMQDSMKMVETVWNVRQESSTVNSTKLCVTRVQATRLPWQLELIQLIFVVGFYSGIECNNFEFAY